MIPLPITWLVFVCLFVTIAGIVFVWICYELAERFQANRKLRNRLRCQLCSMEFTCLDEATALPKCPRCGSLTERSQPKFF